MDDNISSTKGGKLPLDARIIGWFLFYSAIITFGISLLLTSGISQFTSESKKAVVFGLVLLDTELSHGIYLSFISSVNLIAGYGIAKGYKFGWFTKFISSIWFIIDLLLALKDEFIISLASILINLILLVWLIWRRQYYNIGGQRTNSD